MGREGHHAKIFRQTFISHSNFAHLKPLLLYHIPIFFIKNTAENPAFPLGFSAVILFSCLCSDFRPVLEGHPDIVFAVHCDEIHQAAPQPGTELRGKGGGASHQRGEAITRAKRGWPVFRRPQGGCMVFAAKGGIKNGAEGAVPPQWNGTSYLPRAEPSTRPGGVSRSRTEPLAPRAKGPAAPSTLTPVRACQPSGILESTAQVPVPVPVPIPPSEPSSPKGACP